MSDNAEDKWVIRDASVRSLSLRNESALLGSVVTNKVAADLLNIAPATLSTWRTTNMPRAMAILAAHGMKVVDFTDRTIPKDEWRLLVMARMRADRQALQEAGCTVPGELGDE